VQNSEASRNTLLLTRVVVPFARTYAASDRFHREAKNGELSVRCLTFIFHIQLADCLSRGRRDSWSVWRQRIWQMVAKRVMPGGGGGTKRTAQSALEGDLFPRGRGEGDVPRVRKRNGTVIFGGDEHAAADDRSAGRPSKRPRAADSQNRVVQQGEAVAALGMSSKRLSIGMTLLGLVTSSSERGVVLALPAGTKATADANEMLVEVNSTKNESRKSPFSNYKPANAKAHVGDASDTDDAENDSMMSEDDNNDSRTEDEDDQSIRPLFKVVSEGDVVRVAVVSSEKGPTGRWKIVVSCRPSLININLGVVGGAVAGGKSANILRQGELMWGAVKGVEDHGYVIDFGASIPTLGFLPFSEVDEPDARLVPGSPLEVAILESQRNAKKTRKVVRVSRLTAQVHTAVTQYAADMTFAALRAGMRVRARVFKVEEGGGIELRVFGVFPVAVERSHVPFPNVPSVDSSVDARLLYVDAGAKRVGATLLPCLVENRTPRKLPTDWVVGHIIAPVTVARVDQRFGLVLQPGTGGEESEPPEQYFPLFAHVSRISDERMDKLQDSFRPGICIANGARIVSYSPLDGVVNVDLRPSILARKALAVHEVAPGQTYECKIVSHSAAGSLIVAVDGDVHIRGIVPAAHVSDTSISFKRLASHTRFKVGAVLRCVCLTVDEVREKVVLTSKKSLVNSDRPMLSSFSQAHAALKSISDSGGDGSTTDSTFDGCVAAVTENLGVLVVFMGGVRGLVPRSELCLDGTDKKTGVAGLVESSEDGESSRTKKARRASHDRQNTSLTGNVLTRGQVEALFPVGQTVRVRILNVDLSAQRMTLTFNLSSRERQDVVSSAHGIAAGSLLSGVIKSVDMASGCLHVLGRPLEALVESVPGSTSTSSGDSLECILPFEHLSDFPRLAKRITAEYSKVVSSTSSPFPILKMLVLESSGDRPLVTLKASLIAAHEHGVLPKSVQDVFTIYNNDSKVPTGIDGGKVSPGEVIGQVQSRTVLRGYVKAALPSGVIVGFLDGTVGFARKSRISDEFVADPSKVLFPHQSVSVVIDDIDKDRNRFTVSLRLSDVGIVAISEDTRNYFDALSTIRENFGGPQVEAEFPIGAIVDSILDASRPYGMVLQLESPSGAKAYGVALEESSILDPVSPIATNAVPCLREVPISKVEHQDESESFASAAAATAEHYASSGIVGDCVTPVPKSAKKRSVPLSSRKTRKQKASESSAFLSVTPARVLDVDAFTGVVDVSLDPKVVESAGKRSASHGPEKQISTTVLLVKDEYVIVSIPGAKGRTSIGFCLRPNSALKARMHLQRGCAVQCTGLSSCRGRNILTANWNLTSLALGSTRKPLRVVGRRVDRNFGTKSALNRDDIVEGMKVSGKVTAIFALQANIALSRGIVGRVHASNNIVLTSSDIESCPVGPISGSLHERLLLPKPGTMLSNLTVMSVKGRDDNDVVGDTDVTDHGLKEHSREGLYSSSSIVLELSVGDEPARTTCATFVEGQRIIGFVKHVRTNEAGHTLGTWLAFSPSLSGFCPAVDSIMPSENISRTIGDSCVETEMHIPNLAIGSSVLCIATSDAAAASSGASVCMSTNGLPGNDDEQGSFYGIVLCVKPGEGIRVEIPWLARSQSQKDKRWGLVGPCDVSDDFDEAEKLMDQLAVGDIVFVSFVSACEESHDPEIVLLSMRKSITTARRLNNTSDKSCHVPRDMLCLNARKDCVVGERVRGFVRSVSKSGCFVSIGRSLVARVMLSDLADQFVKEPSVSFPAGKLVAGKIAAVDVNDTNKVQLVLRKRAKRVLKGDSQGSKQLQTSPSEGTVYSGTVKRIEKFGALIELPGKLVALLHKSEVDQDRFVADSWSEWIVGQILNVVVIQTGTEGKLRVGTKRCYFEAAGLDDEKVDEILESNSAKRLDRVDGHDMMDIDGDSKLTGEEKSSKASNAIALSSGDGFGNHDDSTAHVSEMEAEDIQDVRDESDQAHSAEDELPHDRGMEGSESDGSENGVLPIPKEYQFEEPKNENNVMNGNSAKDVGNLDSESEGSEDCGSEKDRDVGASARKKSSREKREKKRAKDAAEREIRAREEALASSPGSPETADDFERLLMGQPNGSHIWIRYMAFRVSLSQLDKARALAERALETIALTEELERVNIWIAYINLEATFGSNTVPSNQTETDAAKLRNRTAAVFRVFDRACQRVTDVKDFHLQASAALRHSEPELSDEILRRAAKLFKDSMSVWVAVGTCQFTTGKLQAARHTLERALLSLEKRKHVELILKFAQLEYRHGSEERGRTVFESLVGNFPKRLDLWSVYLDMETARFRLATKESVPADREAAISSVRRIYERCISLDFSTKKTKFIFKRWLSFEVETGDKGAQASVRGKARQYVETKLVPAS
jgi:ribosomal protein S1